MLLLSSHKILGLLLCFFFIPIFYFLFFLSSDEKLDLKNENYKIGNEKIKKWNKVCLSSQYEIVDFEMQKQNARSCRLRKEVPSKSILIIYTHANSCTVKTTSGYLFSERNSETRCFGTEASDYELIKDEDGIVKIRRP